jgi:anthranilate phosphoribosyltransferase
MAERIISIPVPIMTEEHAERVHAALKERQKIDEEAFGCFERLAALCGVPHDDTDDLKETLEEAREIIDRRKKADKAFTELVFAANLPENRVQ